MDLIIIFVCTLGIICAFITILLNINLVVRIVLNASRRKVDMQLFYYRFTLDIFFGTCLLLYIVFILLSMEAPDFMLQYRSLIVYLALPWSNVAACRSIIALTISFDRFIAAYFPISYLQKRSKILTWPIFLIAIFFGLSEELTLFGFCSYDMEIPSTCRVFGCAMNKCFYNFWTIHRSVIFSLIVIFSIMLSIRLFIWNMVKNKKNKNNLSKANRLALLDMCTVLLFDFLPSFCGNMWPTAPIFSFDHVGPYNAALKITGCAIEALVVTLVLMFRQTKKSSSIQPGTIVKNSKNSRL
ncbi:Serpentine Receptor, class BC (Class B-like) [Caenorhabditis elegans]|uniref:Serpentine Receptor, class BC (Class B-like) n=1 Tax=Caenorhabditis elegans TaxID=6239 RepID=Q5F4V0_CAEEL|nr:Serpentine Receptor, class BC (Class B-like) [Caenorhabditis elegans]CCD62482.1 Serpentine Receptor, class BC (Class B-like) [Caenorhabditis elegans]|eukprot:NP_503974.2 Serpentine Receptor, class BC (class B-like) [Caenorhabditis elegans]